MNEIQKARCKLEQICEKGDPGFRDLKPEGQVLFIQQLAREALALLSPEGETRQWRVCGTCKHYDEDCEKVVGYCGVDNPKWEATESAPSSETALREALRHNKLSG